MNDLTSQYNNAPHDTLTRYAGFEVSPNNVHDDPELEYYICRRIAQDNAAITQTQGFRLAVGTKVKVYNELHQFDKRRTPVREEIFEVIETGGHAVKVRGISSGVVLEMPRSKMCPLN
jgi:hypothetical protein